MTILPLTLRTLPTERLSDADRAAILAVCSDAYKEDFREYLRLIGRGVHLLGERAGTLVCHAMWVERELRVGPEKRSLRGAYIEAVATAAAHQRRGHGSTLMRAIPPLLGDFDIAALCPSVPEWYASLGWEPWRGPLGVIHNGHWLATAEEEVMVYRLPRTPADLDLGWRMEGDWREGEVW